MQGPIETYQQAIEFLFGRINYERAQSGSYSASDFKLDRMRRFLAHLGDPQTRLPAIHIAGTKGKGSTAIMISRILSTAGYRVGLFTSPHVSAFEERIQVDSISPSPSQLVDLVNSIIDTVAEMDRLPGRMSPTFFEIATALAWLHFVRQAVDLVVLEVGLGGRLDSTNLCNPEATVVTTISRDHVGLLGSRIEQIAYEKAGIVKSAVPTISGVMSEEACRVIHQVCRQREAPLIQIGQDFRHTYRSGTDLAETTESKTSIDVTIGDHVWHNIPVPILGEHQAHNAALAVVVIDVLRQRGWNIAPQAVYEGMASVRWPLRIEIIQQRPTVVIDAAHNWAAAGALVKTLQQTFEPDRRILIFGTTRDKDVSGLLRQLLPRFDSIILTQYQSNPRAVPVETLASLTGSLAECPVHHSSNPSDAWKLACRLSSPDDLICVTGSFFLAAEMRELLLGRMTTDLPQDSPATDSLAIPESATLAPPR